MSTATGRTASFVEQFVPFTSQCPKCKRERRQDDRTRGELLGLLQAGRAIEAHCEVCAGTWSISDRERSGIAGRI
jgi:hypothetical protein